MSYSSAGKSASKLIFNRTTGKLLISYTACFWIQKTVMKLSMAILGYPIILPDFVQYTLTAGLTIFTSFFWRTFIKPLLLILFSSSMAVILMNSYGNHHHIQFLKSSKVQGAVFFGVIGLYVTWKVLRKLLNSYGRPFYYKTMEQIDAFGQGQAPTVGGTMFEEYLLSIYRQLGYTAHTIAELKKKGIVKIAGFDQGADLLVEYVENGQVKKAVIQCKHYKNNVDNKAIQEAHAAKGFYDCQIAIVVTNAGFTKASIELAKKLNVELVDRQQLQILNERAAQPKLNQMMERVRAA
jgi:hypothetical protein